MAKKKKSKAIEQNQEAAAAALVSEVQNDLQTVVVRKL